MLDVWTSVETLPRLGADEVQVWRIELPDPGTALEQYIHTLSDEERARASRLRAGLVRLQFVVARAALRTLLGNCLGIAPDTVSITSTSFGKPETPGVFYNLAHSGPTVLIALCRRDRVGIDIEYLSREVDALEIAKTSFSLNEYRALSSIADSEARRRIFFRCWTRKEAVIKADGRGLSLSLDSFEVPMQECVAGAFVSISVSEERPGEQYWLSDILYSEDVAAACAIPGPDYNLPGFIFPLRMLAQKP